MVGKGQLGNLLAVAKHRVVRKKDHALRSSLSDILEGLSQVLSAAKLPRNDLDSLPGSRSGDVFEERNVLGKMSPENGDPPRSWKSFEEKLKSLPTKDGVAVGHASDVADYPDGRATAQTRKAIVRAIMAVGLSKSTANWPTSLLRQHLPSFWLLKTIVTWLTNARDRFTPG